MRNAIKAIITRLEAVQNTLWEFQINAEDREDSVSYDKLQAELALIEEALESLGCIE